MAITATPGAGAYAGTQSVVLADGTLPVAYTLDGSDPQASMSQSWASLASSGPAEWMFACVGTDGSIYAATSGNNYIYKSTNGGSTWTALTGAGGRTWTCGCVDSNGTLYVAALGSYIFRSTDGGANWTQLTAAGSKSWYNACTRDGYVYVGVYGGYIYRSTDGGANWTELTTAGSRTWYQASCITADGSVYFATNGGYLYKSADHGSTWTALTAAGSRYWGGYNAVVDKLGNVYFATSDETNYVYKSADAGTTWAALTSLGTSRWRGACVNTDGTLYFAEAFSDAAIHKSTDNGATWSLVTAAGYRAWRFCVAGLDGSIYAAVNNSTIWKGTANFIVSNGILYTQPVTLYNSRTLKAWSSASGVQSFSYEIGAVTATPPAGTYSEVQSVALSAAAPIIYTTNGDDPVVVGSQTWSQLSSSSASWRCGCVGADGALYFAEISTGATGTGYIWKSTNNGASWVRQTTAGSRNWSCCVVSGTSIYFADNGGYIYKSTNGGTSWTALTASTQQQWTCCCVGRAGKLYFGRASGPIYTSADSGTTWTALVGTPSAMVIIAGLDGAIYATPASGYIYKSTDGVTFSTLTYSGSRPWKCGCVGLDGALYFGSGDGYVYKSPDGGGGFWTPLTNMVGSTYWSCCCVDQYGVIYFGNVGAGTSGDYIYVSYDDGATWTVPAEAGRHQWNCCVAAGETLYFGTYYLNYIYKGEPPTYSVTTGTTYTSPLSVSTSQTIKALAVNHTIRWVQSFSYTINIASVSASPNPGSYLEPQNVTLSCPGFDIWYTTDGSDPVPVVNGTLYTTPILATDYATVIKAVGATGATPTTNVATFEYTIGYADPITATPPPGVYDLTQMVSLSYQGYPIVYTTDGTDPTVTTNPQTSAQLTGAGSRRWQCGCTGFDGALYFGASTGYIHKSTDGGTTWSELSTAGSHNWTAAFVGKDGAIYFEWFNASWVLIKSTDHGNTWTTLPSNILMADRGCYCVGNDGALYYGPKSYGAPITKSTDGGVTWVPTGFSGRASACCVDSSGAIYFAVYDFVYKSTNGGTGWTELTAFGVHEWRVFIFAAGALYFADNGGYIYKSTDGGATVTELTSAGTGYWASASSDTAGAIYFSRSYVNTGYIYKSLNGGVDWETLTAVGDLGWAASCVGNDGSIFFGPNNSGSSSYIARLSPGTTAVNGVFYTSPIHVSEQTTIRAIVIHENGLAGPVQPFTYTFQRTRIQGVWVKYNGAWVNVAHVYVAVNGEWKPATSACVAVNGVWRRTVSHQPLRPR